MNQPSDCVSVAEFLDAKRIDATICHLGGLRASWRAMARPQRIDALRVAALSLGNIADRQLPFDQRRTRCQVAGSENCILMGVLALIASALAYTVGVEQGLARCMQGRAVGSAVAPTVVR
jgi:hypothetical protein